MIEGSRLTAERDRADRLRDELSAARDREADLRAELAVCRAGMAQVNGLADTVIASQAKLAQRLARMRGERDRLFADAVVAIEVYERLPRNMALARVIARISDPRPVGVGKIPAALAEHDRRAAAEGER